MASSPGVCLPGVQSDEEKDELFEIGVGKTRDKAYVVLEIESSDTTEIRYLRSDRPQESFTALLPREKKHRYYLDHREGLFYIRTNKPGKDFAVVTATASDPVLTELEGFHSPSGRRADSRRGPLQGLRCLDRENGGAGSICVSIRRRPGRGATFAFPEPVYAAFPAGTAGL